MAQKKAAKRLLIKNGSAYTASDSFAADILIERYNASGIQYRMEKDFEKSVMIFKKARITRSITGKGASSFHGRSLRLPQPIP